jgi:hypothetical protein
MNLQMAAATQHEEANQPLVQRLRIAITVDPGISAGGIERIVDDVGTRTRAALS